MKNYEVRASQFRIVQDCFQQQRIASALSIVTSEPSEAVNVHSHSQSATLARDVMKEKILEHLVIGRSRNAALYITTINLARSQLIRTVEIEFTQVRNFKLDRNCSVLLLP